MLDKVKNALRVKTAAFDDEIQDLIDACKADLRLVGVNVPEDTPAEGKEGKLRIFRRQREIPRGLRLFEVFFEFGG
jgi:hypothetical protein